MKNVDTQQHRYLVLGSGAREHALVQKLLDDGAEVECAPGSDAIAELVPCWNFSNFDELISQCKLKSLDRVIVGPEAYLADGVQNHLERADIHCVGPSKQAALLETDKAWAKSFCIENGIPTAKAEKVETAEQLSNSLKSFSPPYVVKASGLAAGKGVWIGDSPEEALRFGKEVLKKHSSLVVEEFLEGQELSLFYYIDGANFIYLGGAQDHKRLLDDDQGPNTGGMGAYSPAPIASETLIQSVENKILKPTIQGLEKERYPYRGFLFLGLMIHGSDAKLLEYNCRLGDPEAQVILSRMKTPLIDVLESRVQSVEIDPQQACGVVVAARGYPQSPEKGFEIGPLDESPEIQIYHAGTQKKAGSWIAKGGRLFTVVSKAGSLVECQNKVYSFLEAYSKNPNLIFRKDIGAKANKD